MLNINEAVNVVKRQFSSLISVIKNTTFDSHITNLDEIEKIKFPVIQDVNVIGDTTSDVLEDLNSTLSNHLEDIKNKIEPTEIDFSSVIAKLDTLKDPSINKKMEDLLTTISKKEVSFKSLEKQLANIEDTFKKHYNKKKDKNKELNYTGKFDELKEVLSSIYVPTPPKVVGSTNKVGTRINPSTSDNQNTLIEMQTYSIRWAKKSTNSNIIYTGESIAGSAEGDAVWQIEEFDCSSGTGKYADGDINFDNIYSNRESLIYT